MPSPPPRGPGATAAAAPGPTLRTAGGVAVPLRARVRGGDQLRGLGLPVKLRGADAVQCRFRRD